MSSLGIEQIYDGSKALLKLSGQIDEGADYSAIKLTGVTALTFDFEKVKLINSTGLQGWIKFLASIDPSVNIVFIRCSIRVISQINMFPGFLGSREITIESFFAPYFCEACDSPCDLLIEVTPHLASLRANKAPAQSCPRCGAPAEFDGIEKKFFLFLKPGSDSKNA